MSDKLARFKNLEPPVADVPSDDEFKEARRRDLASGLDVEAAPAEEQPYLRCPWCEADNSKFAEKCLNCGRALQTDEVLGWNARMWAERRAAMDAEKEQAAASEHVKMDQAQRRVGEALAAEVKQNELLRMAQSDVPDYTPLGLRMLLALSPSGQLTFVVILVSVLLSALLAAVRAPAGSAGRMIGGGVAILVVSLFAPVRRRRWWW